MVITMRRLAGLRGLAVALPMALALAACSRPADGGQLQSQDRTPSTTAQSSTSQSTTTRSENTKASQADAPRGGKGRILGRVLDDLGDPLASAEVLLLGVSGLPRLKGPAEGSPARRTRTDTLGRFQLRHVPAAPLLLVVRHPYWQPCLVHREQRLAAGDTWDLGDLVLDTAPGVVVEVRARESQQPLQGARVHLSPALEDAALPAVVLEMFRHQAETGADGHAPLYAVSEGAYVLRVEADGRATVELRHQQPASVSRALRIPVDLPKGSTLCGRVLDPGGTQPVSSARIVCMADGGRLSHEASSDARGEFRISGLLPQPYRLMVTHEEHGPLVRDDVVPDAQPQILVLPKGNAVCGRVLDGVTRRPVPGSRVTVQVPAGWPVLRQGVLVPPTAVTDADGRFRVGGLPGGIAWATAESEGSFAPKTGPIQPGSGEITLLLRAGSRVTGRVQDPASRPLPDALVQVIPRKHDGTPHPALAGAGNAGRRGLPRTFTGSSGRFDLGGLPPGSYRLLVKKAGLPPFLSDVFAASPGGSSDLGTLQVPAGGRIQGVARDHFGQPAVGATVCVDPLAGLPPEAVGAEAVCDAQGRFALGPVAPGEYQMFYYSPGKQTAAEAAASRHDTLIRIQVPDHGDLVRNLHPRSR